LYGYQCELAYALACDFAAANAPSYFARCLREDNIVSVIEQIAERINEKTGSEKINIQYAEGAAAMPRRGGRRCAECGSIEPENQHVKVGQNMFAARLSLRE
jgi:hypothetical protein